MSLALALAFLLFPQEVSETVTVQRAMLDARIVDSAGRPIRDLKPSDFRATMEKKRVDVLSVSWVSETTVPEYDDTYLEAMAASKTLVPPEVTGRNFILLFQTDFARLNSHIAGEMAFLPYAEKIVTNLPPHDRVAVFSFDSHLKFRLDLTENRQQVRRAMDGVTLIDDPRQPPPVSEPSLATCLDRDSMRRAATMEDALLLIARAAAEIPGHKEMIILGHGFGYPIAGQVLMEPNWDEVKSRLIAADVVVDAIYTPTSGGPLVLGLARASSATGGFFMSAGDLKQQAVDRFSQGELSGHYELELRPPDGTPPGPHEVQIRVKGMRYTVTITLD
jgi:VWFA-related protein